MENTNGEKHYSIEDLQYLMTRLRDPETGCPWDLKQNFSTIVPYTLEEVYEVIDTIERKDFQHLNEELGDLLFQVVFYAQLGTEQNLFDFNKITTSIVTKLLTRHPHVFPQGTLESVQSPGQQQSEQAIKKTWESLKKTERAEKGNAGILDDIPRSQPALIRAEKIQKRAANEGFDWSEIAPVLDKVEEEIAELRVAIEHNDKAEIEDEFGDVLFSLVNFSRHQGLNAESALRKATKKFENRFRFIEQQASEEGKTIAQLSVDEMEAYWQQAKGNDL